MNGKELGDVKNENEFIQNLFSFTKLQEKNSADRMNKIIKRG